MVKYIAQVLHFHEREEASSLIVFSNNKHQEGSNQLALGIVTSSAAFKYNKFYLYDDFLKWYERS